jgi:hypothetical protein
LREQPVHMHTSVGVNVFCARNLGSPLAGDLFHQSRLGGVTSDALKNDIWS